MRLPKFELKIDWDKIFDYIFYIGTVIIVTYLVIFIVRFLLTQFFKRTSFVEEKKAQTIESVFKNTVNYIGFFVIIISSLNPFFDIKNVLVAGGVLGIVIGFGAQSAIKDILYGFFFLFEGQFRKGDFVNINGSPDGGTVEELGFRALKVRLLNGKLLTVSNGEIKEVVNGNIGKRRIMEGIIVSFEEDPVRVKEILEELCEELNEKHKDYLYKDEESHDYEEEYRFYGMSNLDYTTVGYRYVVSATTRDVDFFVAVQEAKLTIAKRLFDEKIKMAQTYILQK